VAESVVYIPFERELYSDIVRFSDGRIDPAELARAQVLTWVQLSFGVWDEHWGDRADEAAEKYAPWLLEDRDRKTLEITSAERTRNRPLVWKELSVAPGTEVRMTYNRTDHFAVVQNGKIVDHDGQFSPNEWALKVTGTARNAWRDLWFKEPHSPGWISARALRDRATSHMQAGGPHD
jgi:hypothetical protein